MPPIRRPSALFHKSKGRMPTKNRKTAHIPTKHIDMEGTVHITFSPDGLLIQESISWDGEKDATRIVLLPTDPGEESSGGDGGAHGEGDVEGDGGCREGAVAQEGYGEESARERQGDTKTD